MYENFCDIPPASFLSEAYDNNTSYSDVTWLTAHNAFANNEDGWLFYYQQTMNQKNLFNFGVRSFMLDLHYFDEESVNSDIYLCHGSCLTTYAQKGSAPNSFSSWLKDTYDLLSTYYNEIVSLHLESYVTSNDIKKALVENKLDELLLKSKSPDDKSLTLGEMRKTNQRLIVFSDYGYGHGVKGENYYIEGIYSTKKYKETQYSLENYKSCEMRLDNRALPESTVNLFVFNHITSISNTAVDYYGKINKYCDIMSRIDLCVKKGFGYPNFLVLDFVEKGECFEHCSGKTPVFLLNHYKKYSSGRESLLHPETSQEFSTWDIVKNVIGYHGSSIVGLIMDYKIPWIILGWATKDIVYTPIVAPVQNYFVDRMKAYLVDPMKACFFMCYRKITGRQHFE